MENVMTVGEILDALYDGIGCSWVEEGHSFVDEVASWVEEARASESDGYADSQGAVALIRLRLRKPLPMPQSHFGTRRDSCTIIPMETNGNRKQRNQEMNRLLGRRLATMRIANGIRQEEVAEAMGFMRPLVSKIEAGRRALDATEIPAYAHAIGVTSRDVFDAILEIHEEFGSITADQRSVAAANTFAGLTHPQSSSSSSPGASTHMPSLSSQTYVSNSCSPRPDLIACTRSTKLPRISPPGCTTRNDSQQSMPLTDVGTPTAIVYQRPRSSVRPIWSTIQDRSSQPGCASGSAVLTNQPTVSST